jgi:type I restriction enzyme R subunit
MVVCMSRRICVDLYNALIALRPEWHCEDDEQGALKVVMTGSATDPPEWQQHIRNKPRRERLANRFKDPEDSFRVVIVPDMWLTGFDAPCLHTMYLDKPMSGHNLMQGIARVNRVFRDKPGGLVVDYLGLADNLKKALAAYSPTDRDSTGIDQAEAVAILEEKLDIVRTMFRGFDYSGFRSADKQARLALLQAATNRVYDLDPSRDRDENRKRFMQAVTDVSRASALAVPHEYTLSVRDEVGFFQAVRGSLASAVPERSRSPEEVEAAIRQIVSKSVLSGDVVDILAAAGLQKPDISILSDEFLADVRGMAQKNLAVEALRRLIEGQIKAKGRTNVVEARSFAELLEQSIVRYRNRSVEAAQVIEELIALAKEMREADKRGEKLGLTEDELAFYDALADNKSAVEVMGDESLRVIAQELLQIVRQNATIDWSVRESTRAKLRVIVKRILRKYGYPPDLQEKATDTVLQQAERLCEHWVPV